MGAKVAREREREVAAERGLKENKSQKKKYREAVKIVDKGKV